MLAKFERRKTELYAMDLIWLLARTHYDIQSPSPTKMELFHTPADRRTAQEIRDDMLKKARK